MRTNEEVAEMLLERLAELGPAVSVEDGDKPWQVHVSITMSRNSPKERGEEMAKEEFRG